MKLTTQMTTMMASYPSPPYPQGQNNLHPLILHNSLDEEQVGGDEDDKDKEDNDDDKDNNDEAMVDHAADNADESMAEAEDRTEEQQESGVRRSK